MSLALYNTLSGQVETFLPASPPEVGMYVCGLTVYGRGHIGNYRSFTATDLLRRTLRYKGWRVKHVMNVTDVDDRIIRLAAEAGRDLREFTADHIASFREDMATLRMEAPEVVPRATEHIGEMVELIEALTRRGHTYTAEDGVYFRIASFPQYGQLSGLDKAGIKDGARVDTDKYDK
jgi:cysteinyl-tRNA synthetase